MTEDELVEQLVRATDDWICTAAPEDLLKVLIGGGLDASMVDLGDEITVFIELGDRRGLLSSVGILGGDLPADEALALYAQAWGASEPPADDRAQQAWLASDGIAQEAARQHLLAAVEENIDLFVAVAAQWFRQRSGAA
ncbi:hypothetical protein QTI24_30720 [Variovorax sp. J22P240]|uniref:hypothetical protein n=1 Tax=Variovorax sp. J22P240 TaxID=3053514 RepID=UPI002574F7E4|nr:hypothetical protein [Variovorax sp. J22P240]MDM0002993.1 hypothetical protein [Variovorax sp. J22P240]